MAGRLAPTEVCHLVPSTSTVSVRFAAEDGMTAASPFLGTAVSQFAAVDHVPPPATFHVFAETVVAAQKASMAHKPDTSILFTVLLLLFGWINALSCVFICLTPSIVVCSRLEATFS